MRTSPFSRTPSRTIAYRFVQIFVVGFLKLFWRWRFIDLHRIPAEGPVLIVANHISYFDPLAHALCVNESGRVMQVFAKAELFNMPIVGSVLRRSRMIPVERGTGEAGPIIAAEEALRQGGLIMLYPESTLTKNADLMPMQGKTGVARLALATGATVVPMAVWGSQWVLPKKARFFHALRGRVLLKVGEPMRFPELLGQQDDPDVRRDVTDRVMKELEILVRDLHDLHPRGAAVPKLK